MKKSKKIIIINIICIILIGVLIYSGIKIYNWYKENENSKKVAKQISETVTIQQNENEEESGEQKQYIIDFNSLKEQNDQTVAWIKVNNTSIEYPIVKTSNNSYYLTHSFDKTYNSAGWPFADYKNKFDGTDKNIVLYGHNRKDGSMFATLKSILSPEWYNNEENRNIIFNTENENSIYEVFSVYQIKNEEYYIQTEFKNESKFAKFLETIKKRSVKDFEVEVTSEDSILTLSTCANNNKYRVVLHAKKVLNNEQE